MTKRTAIERDTWVRNETFEHYRVTVPCSYAVTAEIDVTTLTAVLRERGLKTYPAQIWAVSTIINRHAEFRMDVDEHGAPFVFDIVHPAFTVFNPARETFASVWTEHDPDFPRFHAAVVDLLREHRGATQMFPQGPAPANSFDVSSLPWASFTSMTLAIEGGFEHFRPILTLGRYREGDGRTLLPVAFQIHHAAADGFHTARFFTELQELCDDAAAWAVGPAGA